MSFGKLDWNGPNDGDALDFYSTRDFQFFYRLLNPMENRKSAKS